MAEPCVFLILLQILMQAAIRVKHKCPGCSATAAPNPCPVKKLSKITGVVPTQAAGVLKIAANQIEWTLRRSVNFSILIHKDCRGSLLQTNLNRNQLAN
jgi:hypothetical protein